MYVQPLRLANDLPVSSKHRTAVSIARISMSASKSTKRSSDYSGPASTEVVERMVVEPERVSSAPGGQTSRFRGVFPSGKRFKAEIVINGIKRGLGEFDTEIEAAKAYEAYARTVAGGPSIMTAQQDANKKARLVENAPLARPLPLPLPVDQAGGAPYQRPQPITSYRPLEEAAARSTNSSAPAPRGIAAALAVPSMPVPSPSAQDEHLRQQYWQQMQQQHMQHHQQQQHQLQHQQQQQLQQQRYQMQQQTVYAPKAPAPIPHTVPIMGTTVHAGVPVVYIPVPMPIAPSIMQSVNEYYQQQLAAQAQYAVATRHGYQAPPVAGSYPNGGGSRSNTPPKNGYAHPAMSVASLGLSAGIYGGGNALNRYSPELASHSNGHDQRYGTNARPEATAYRPSSGASSHASALAASFAQSQRGSSSVAPSRAAAAALPPRTADSPELASGDSDADSGNSDVDETAVTKRDQNNSADVESYVESETDTAAEATPTAELSWRDQRFHWSGTLAFDTVRQAQVWKGLWLGYFSVRPSKEDFKAATENSFEYLSTKIRKNTTPMTALDDSFMPQSGYFKGHYFMDSDGSGMPRKYTDKDCVLVFEATNPAESPPHQFIAFGRGACEFGSFVMFGKFDNRTNAMDIVRQYVTANDERGSMTLKQLKVRFEKDGEFL